MKKELKIEVYCCDGEGSDEGLHLIRMFVDNCGWLRAELKYIKKEYEIYIDIRFRFY